MTESLADYLETIGMIIAEDGNARVKDVAQRMNVSKPSVHNALHELSDRGFVNHEHYGDITFTESGDKAFSDLRAKHVVLKKFLIEVVGVGEETAERDACRIEHVLSDETLARIARLTE